MSSTPETGAVLPSLDDTLARFEHLLASNPHPSTQANVLGENFSVCQAAARALGMAGDQARGGPLPDAGVAETAASMGLCARDVELSGHWWLHDHGVLIAQERGTGRPVLVRSHRGRTAMACTEPGGQGRLRPLTAERAATLETRAVALHPTLPQKPLRFGHVLKAGIRLYPFDVAAYVLLGVLVALLAYAVPTASGLVVDRVIPHRSLSLLRRCWRW